MIALNRWLQMNECWWWWWLDELGDVSEQFICSFDEQQPKKNTPESEKKRQKKMACNKMDEQKHSKLSSLTLVAFEWETKNARETEWEWERIKHSMTLPICFGSVCDNWHKVSVSSNQIKSMLLLCHTQTQTNARAICSTVSWSWHSVTQCNA